MIDKEIPELEKRAGILEKLNTNWLETFFQQIWRKSTIEWMNSKCAGWNCRNR